MKYVFVNREQGLDSKEVFLHLMAAIRVHSLRVSYMLFINNSNNISRCSFASLSYLIPHQHVTRVTRTCGGGGGAGD